MEVITFCKYTQDGFVKHGCISTQLRPYKPMMYILTPLHLKGHMMKFLGKFVHILLCSKTCCNHVYKRILSCLKLAFEFMHKWTSIYKGNLSIKVSFRQSLQHPLNIGFTVLLKLCHKPCHFFASVSCEVIWSRSVLLCLKAVLFVWL